MNKWIPVTEKLPERDGLYIVTFDGGLVGQKEPFASTNYFENGQWLSPGCHCRSHTDRKIIKKNQHGEIGY